MIGLYPGLNSIILVRGIARGGWVVFQVLESYDHLHITIHLTMGKTDYVCSPTSIISKNNIIPTR